MLGDAAQRARRDARRRGRDRLPRPARLVLLAGIAGLTAASEKVSFTKVIARTPPLNWLDMLGRRAPAPAGAPGGPRRRRRPRCLEAEAWPRPACRDGPPPPP